MKFTLKNRPEIIALFDSSQQELEEWFEGFERELREKLKQFDEGECEHYIIEEILGE